MIRVHTTYTHEVVRAVADEIIEVWDVTSQSGRFAVAFVVYSMNCVTCFR